jgi:hypothetical protein
MRSISKQSIITLTKMNNMKSNKINQPAKSSYIKILITDESGMEIVKIKLK